MSDIWNKEFPITSVTRRDVKTAGIPRSVVAKLTDGQMAAISRKMGEYYVEYGHYWEHVKTACEYVLGRKEHGQQITGGTQ